MFINMKGNFTQTIWTEMDFYPLPRQMILRADNVSNFGFCPFLVTTEVFSVLSCRLLRP